MGSENCSGKHNPEVAGSNPVSATEERSNYWSLRFLVKNLTKAKNRYIINNSSVRGRAVVARRAQDTN